MMEMVFSWLPALLAIGAIALAVPGIIGFFRSQREFDNLERRLNRPIRDASAALDGDGAETAIDKAFYNLADRTAPSDEGELNLVKAKLRAAGITHPSAVGRYYFARILCILVPQVGLYLSLPYLPAMPITVLIAMSGGLVLAGLSAPGYYLAHLAETRRQDCARGFPDMMDLLVACVEAGLSLDAAVQRVGEELDTRHPIVADFMRTLSLELRAGRERKAAWRGFADRMGIEEASSLATMLRQAEEMGTSLGQTLRVFSADMRQRRILMAEEKAMALPAKMTVPLIVFVFPCLLGVLILPAIVTLQAVML